MAWARNLLFVGVVGGGLVALVVNLLPPRHPAHVTARLAPALAGLRLVADGGSFAPDGTADGGRARRLLGWTTDGHWLAPDPTAVETTDPTTAETKGS